MTRIRLALLLLGLLPVTTVTAAPDHAPWPGGIAVIDVGPAEAPRPIVEFDALVIGQADVLGCGGAGDNQ